MSTFTLCFCGTDCYLDEGFVNRADSGGTDPAVYGQAGYIPAKIYQDLNAPYHSALVPGPGKPYMDFKSQLWVPPTALAPSALIDTALGLSMWDLAGHAAAKVVGSESVGRAEKCLMNFRDDSVRRLINQVKTTVGAELGPNSRKPPSHNRYQWNTDKLKQLLATVYNKRGVIDTINLIGHSRGGVNAIICSHELATLFPNARVNIFAIDPVPGAGTLSKEMMSLGPTVVNYVGVYAIDEVSNGFNGVVPRRLIDGKYIDPLATGPGNRLNIPGYYLIYSPGRHGTVAGNQTLNGTADKTKTSGVIAYVGHLVDRLARACLKRWGSPIEPLNTGTPQSLKAGAANHPELYRKMRETTYTGPILPGYLTERGITSTSGSNPRAWCYLEDAIGKAPLVARSGLHGDRLPGKVWWQSILNLNDQVFLSEDKDFDQQRSDLWLA